MAVEPRITFRHMKPSDAIEQVIREKVAKLEKLHDKIMSFDVVVEEPHRSHNKGDLFHIRIHIAVPGGEIDVVRDPADALEHEDPYVAVRDAFEAARKQLLSHARKTKEKRREAAE